MLKRLISGQKVWTLNSENLIAGKFFMFSIKIYE